MEHVALLGYGRFGRAFGELLAEAGIPYRALDPRAEVPPEVRADSVRSLVEGAGSVVLAVPVPFMHSALETLRPHLNPSQLVMDVGSVKVKPVEALAQVLGRDIPWVGTHPLFGPVSLSRAERPLRVVLCPNPLHPDAAGRARALYSRLGCEIIEQTPDEHDQVMAHTHALTFFIARGLIDAGAGREVPFAPPSFQAIARTIETVRADAGHLFAAIQAENPYAKDARQQLVEALERIHGELEAAPPRAETPPELRSPEAGHRSPELTETRERIDELDRELLALLERRVHLAQRAAKAKARLGYPVMDAAREAELLQARRRWAEAQGLDPAGVEEIFRTLLRFSRRAQHDLPPEPPDGGQG